MVQTCDCLPSFGAMPQERDIGGKYAGVIRAQHEGSEAELLDEVVDRILESLIEPCLDALFPSAITRIRKLALNHGRHLWRYIPVRLSILLVTPEPQSFDRMSKRELFEELLRDCVRFHSDSERGDDSTAIIAGGHSLQCSHLTIDRRNTNRALD